MPIGRIFCISKASHERAARIGRTTFNRPDVLNILDDERPHPVADCVARANTPPGTHVIVLSGTGRTFLGSYAQDSGRDNIERDMSWGPMKDTFC